MRLGVRCSPAPLGTVEEFSCIKEGKGNLRVIPLFGSLAQGWEYRLDAYSLLKVGSNPISSAIINYIWGYGLAGLNRLTVYQKIESSNLSSPVET